jgi:hypothetical protein
LVDATLISTSRPSDVYRTPSALSVRSLLRRFTMATTVAPRARTTSTVRLVSVVVPLWLTAITSVSDMSGRTSKPESSVASIASTSIGRSRSSSRIDTATLSDATAAVPWPMVMMRRIAPDANRSRRAGDSVSSPSTTRSVPSRSINLPRSVLRNDDGASEISLRR